MRIMLEGEASGSENESWTTMLASMDSLTPRSLGDSRQGSVGSDVSVDKQGGTLLAAFMPAAAAARKRNPSVKKSKALLVDKTTS